MKYPILFVAFFLVGCQKPQPATTPARGPEHDLMDAFDTELKLAGGALADLNNPSQDKTTGFISASSTMRSFDPAEKTTVKIEYYYWPARNGLPAQAGMNAHFGEVGSFIFTSSYTVQGGVLFTPGTYYKRTWLKSYDFDYFSFRLNCWVKACRRQKLL